MLDCCGLVTFWAGPFAGPHDSDLLAGGPGCWAGPRVIGRLGTRRDSGHPQAQEGAAGYTGSYTAYTVLPRIDDEQCHTETHPQVET